MSDGPILALIIKVAEVSYKAFNPAFGRIHFAACLFLRPARASSACGQFEAADFV